MIAGRYTLEREIGRGGAGTVHLAHDELLGRSVAIKRIGLLPGTTGHDIARAEREARLAAGISHSHVVSIFDLVKDTDCYWLVMEYVQGRTLTELVAAEGPLPHPRAAGIVAQAADALAQANKAGIVHRDVKPSNLLVDEENHAKLGDFGIARASNDAALTQTGLVTGSPAYIAPEVASGEPATAASDVWSLGGTLYFAVTGRAPYDMGQNVLGGMYKIVHEDPPRLPGDHPLAPLLAAMMTKDPAQRWPVLRVRDELRRIASDRTARVAPPVTPDPTPTRTASQPVQTIAPTPAPTPTAALTSSPTPPGSGAAGSRSRGPGRWIAALLVLAVLAGLGTWLLWPGDGDRPATTAGPEQTGKPSASEEPSQEPTEEPTETETSEEPTTEPSPAQGGAAAQRAAMQAFVEDYFARVTSDPRSTFEQLTPQFQAESGGYGDYAGFWRTISSARAYDITADPKTLVTSYTIDYVTTSGDTKTEQGTLRLEKQGEQYLIAGEG